MLHMRGTLVHIFLDRTDIDIGIDMLYSAGTYDVMNGN